LFHADGRTDKRIYMTNLIVAFLEYAKAPNNIGILGHEGNNITIVTKLVTILSCDAAAQRVQRPPLMYLVS